MTLTGYNTSLLGTHKNSAEFLLSSIILCSKLFADVPRNDML
jgi:hypothetical protein